MDEETKSFAADGLPNYSSHQTDMYRYLLGDKIDPNAITYINKPAGSIIRVSIPQGVEV